MLEHLTRNLRVKLHDLPDRCLELRPIHGLLADDAEPEEVVDISLDVAMQQGEGSPKVLKLVECQRVVNLIFLEDGRESVLDGLGDDMRRCWNEELLSRRHESEMMTIFLINFAYSQVQLRFFIEIVHFQEAPLLHSFRRSQDYFKLTLPASSFFEKLDLFSAQTGTYPFNRLYLPLSSFQGGLIECFDAAVDDVKQRIDAFFGLGTSFLHGEAFSLNLLKNEAFSFLGQKSEFFVLHLPELDKLFELPPPHQIEVLLTTVHGSFIGMKIFLHNCQEGLETVDFHEEGLALAGVLVKEVGGGDVLEKVEEVDCWQHVALGKNLKVVIDGLSFLEKEAAEHEVPDVVGEDPLLVVLG